MEQGNKIEGRRVDNAANIYLPSNTENFTSVFVLSMRLNSKIDKKIIESSVQKVLNRMPLFKTKIVEGKNTYMLADNEETPVILSETDALYSPFDFEANKGYHWRLRVKDNEVFLECSHALADANGGTAFLSSIMGEYLKEKYGINISYNKNVLNPDDAPSAEEYRDDCSYFKRKKTLMISDKKAYQIKGTSFGNHGVNEYCFVFNTNDLKNIAKKYGFTITEFLGAVTFYSIQKYKEKYDPKETVAPAIQIPINLRNFYQSSTQANFTSYANIHLQKNKHYTFLELLEYVKDNLRKELEEERLNRRFTLNVQGTDNVLMNTLPIGLKKQIFKVAYQLFGESCYTCLLSNLNKVNLPEEMLPYVEGYKFSLGRYETSFGAFGCATVKDKTCLTLSQRIDEKEFKEIFLKTLSQVELPCEVEYNRYGVKANEDVLAQ